MTDRKEYFKQYKERNKEQVKEYSKQYYWNNRDKELCRCKAYREENKEFVNRKIKCELCGEVVCIKGLKRHMNTDKCKTKSLENQSGTVFKS